MPKVTMPRELIVRDRVERLGELVKAIDTQADQTESEHLRSQLIQLGDELKLVLWPARLCLGGLTRGAQALYGLTSQNTPEVDFIAWLSSAEKRFSSLINDLGRNAA